MPKGRPKKTQEPSPDLLNVLSELAQSVKGLTERVEGLEKPKEEVKEEAPAETTADTVTISETSFPIPVEYKETIESVLNRGFGIKIEPLADRPAFILTIIVPEKYSNMSQEQKDTFKADLRSKVISYAEGTNGVRVWAEGVYNNLGPEIQAIVTQDRVNLQ